MVSATLASSSQSDRPSCLQLTPGALLQLDSAAGSEMVKVTCEEESFRNILLDLVHSVQEERQVPREWADATQITISKKKRPQGL